MSRCSGRDESFYITVRQVDRVSLKDGSTISDTDIWGQISIWHITAQFYGLLGIVLFSVFECTRTRKRNCACTFSMYDGKTAKERERGGGTIWQKEKLCFELQYSQVRIQSITFVVKRAERQEWDTKKESIFASDFFISHIPCINNELYQQKALYSRVLNRDLSFLPIF